MAATVNDTDTIPFASVVSVLAPPAGTVLLEPSLLRGRLRLLVILEMLLVLRTPAGIEFVDACSMVVFENEAGPFEAIAKLDGLELIAFLA